MEWIVLALIGYIAIKGNWAGKIKSHWGQSEIATNIQLALSQYEKMGYFRGDAGDAARSYLQHAQKIRPDAFKKPLNNKHEKMVASIFTLSLAAQKLHEEKNVNIEPVVLALGKMIMDFYMAMPHEDLTPHYQNLFDEANAIYRPLQEEDMQKFNASMRNSPIKTFRDYEVQ
jgi:hypothetical protein